MPKLPRNLKNRLSRKDKTNLKNGKVSIKELKNKVERAQQDLYNKILNNPEMKIKDFVDQLEYTRKDKKITNFIKKELGDLKVKDLKMQHLDIITALYTKDLEVQKIISQKIKMYKEKKDLIVANQRIKLANTYKDNAKFKEFVKKTFTKKFIKDNKQTKIKDIKSNNKYFQKIQKSFGELTVFDFVDTIQHAKKVLKIK
jgi:hypothetical protein